jgi:hypothetical protein
MKVFHRFLLTVFIPGLFLPGHPLLANNVNPTAPIEALKHWHNDFTDTDGDGMTDVAELKYGFNPNDASSFPSKDYTLLDESLEWGKNLDEDKYPPLHNSSGILDKQNDYLFILKPSDYDAYNDIPADWNPLGLLNQAVTPEEALKLEREFINLLTPILFEVVGRPYEPVYIQWRLHNSIATASYSYSDDGSKYSVGIKVGQTDGVETKIHEIFHAYRRVILSSGEYVRFDGLEPEWKYHKTLEEGFAVAVASHLGELFVEAYPTHPFSKSLAIKSSYDNSQKTANNGYNFDFNHGEDFVSSGRVDFFVQGLNKMSDWAYEFSGALAKTLIDSKPGNLRKLIEAVSTKRKKGEIQNIEDLHNVWSQIVPTINGISYKDYISRAKFWDGKDLDYNRLYVSLIDSNFYINYFQNEDDVFWYLNGDPERKPELPSWISPVKQEDFDHFGIREFQDYYVFDWSDTFFEISVQNMNNEVVKMYNKKVNKSTMGESYLFEISPEYLSLGLYKTNINVPQYEHLTSHTQNTKYIVGRKNLTLPSNRKTILIGADVPNIQSIKIELNQKWYDMDITNNLGVIQPNDVYINYTGEAKIRITANNQTNEYIRTISHQGIPDTSVYLQFKLFPLNEFLIVDRDFDGTEDAYDQNISEEETYVENPITPKDPIPAPIPDNPVVENPIPENPISEKTARINELETLVEKLTSDKSNLVNENQNLSTTINTHSQTINSLNADIVLLNQSVVEWQNKYNTQNQEVQIINKSKQNYFQQLEDNNNTIQILGERIDALERENVNLTHSYNSVYQENVNLNEQISFHKEEQRRYSSTISDEFKTKSTYTSDWYFDTEKGWLFTNPDVFPYVFRAETNQWFFFSENKKDARLFYSYENEKWELWKK